jgi:hypothetical protein
MEISTETASIDNGARIQKANDAEEATVVERESGKLAV